MNIRQLTHRNNNFLNTLIYTAIKDNLLPSSFKQVVGQNTSRQRWKAAYEDGLDDGFEYASYNDEDTDFYRRWRGAATLIMNDHVAIWRSKPYQRFNSMAQVGLNIIRQGAPSLLPQFSKILIHFIRQGIGMTSELQRLLAQGMGINLRVATTRKNQSVVPNCRCVQNEMNGLDGGQIAESNKTNWGNVATTVLVGVTAGYALNEGINYLSNKNKGKSTGLSGLSAGQRKGYNKLKKITARAKQIQKANPRKKWKACISQAAKELK
ncbi:hypothetical protein WAF17_10855 [Bernardetia sp. ABR2-2B]|uniref:hypothetical protein n=1 Tax=Bernardetia sp. ABR2-2B TaxID=3127472 RepID=UPI0030CC97F6